MKELKKSLVLVLTLMFTMVIFTGTAFAKQSKDKNGQGNSYKHRLFQSTDAKGHWAEPSIVLMGSEGIVKGYEDGSFRPENNVSREESLALLVRQMGLNADGYTASGYDFDGQARISPWAKSWVALAVDKGIVKKDELKNNNFLEPASRNEVAMWVVRASNLEGEALKSNGLILPFDDSSTIPVFARGYIYVAFNKGIITGYPGRMFKGNGKITRAEMVTVMFRARNCFEMPSTQAGFHFINGMVAEVDDSSITIRRGASFVIANQRNFEVTVSDDALIYLDGKIAELDDIKKGYAVSILADPDQEAVVIIARSVNGQDEDEDEDIDEIEGLIESVSSTSITVKVDGEYKVYQLASGVDVELDGDDADLDDLEKGYDVKIEIENNRVIEIKAFSDSDKEVSGVLQSVSQTSITVKVYGEYEVYQLSDDVDVEMDGDDADIDDLEKGYEVKLEIENDEVTEITATSENEDEVSGVISSIGSTSITVKVDGENEVYQLGDDVDVELDGDKADIDDLEKGYEVELSVEDNEVISIEASSGEVVEGVLNSVGTENITVKVNGVYKVYELDSNVEVFIDGSEKELDDLDNGMEVILILDPDNDEVNTIKADN